MTEINGNKYINHKTFWPIMGASFAFSIIVGSFLWSNIDDIKKDIVPMKVHIAEIRKDISSILEKFETQEIGVAPPLPDDAVLAPYPTIPDFNVKPLTSLVEPYRIPISNDPEVIKMLERLGISTSTTAH